MVNSPRRRTAPAPKSIEQLLDDQLSSFDGLMADVRGGIRSPNHFDKLEERANAIASGIRNAFRVGNRKD